MASQPAASPARVTYFLIGQVVTLCCVLVSALILFSRSKIVLVMMHPVALPLYFLVIAQGPLAAITGSFVPAVPKARGTVVAYGSIVLLSIVIPFIGRVTDGIHARLEQRKDSIRSAIADARWADFDAAVGSLPIPTYAIIDVAYGCGEDRIPPLEVFTRALDAADLSRSQRTLVAALCGTKATRFVLAHGGVVFPNQYSGPSPLAFAHDDEVFALLRAAGATAEQRDPKRPGDPGFPSLFYAYSAAAVTRLVAAGADPLATTVYGRTALYEPPWSHCVDGEFCFHWSELELDRVKRLLELGIPVDSRDKNGTTALMNRASEAGTWSGDEAEQVVALLLRAGADPYRRDYTGKSAIDHLRSSPTRIPSLQAQGLLTELVPSSTAGAAASDPQAGPTVEQLRAAATSLLETWKNAQDNGDADGYFGLYEANEFKGLKRTHRGKVASYDFAAWRKDREAMFAHAFEVAVEDPQIETFLDPSSSLKPGLISVRLLQRWRSKTYADHGPKTLLLSRHPTTGQLSIVYEELQSSRPGWD